MADVFDDIDAQIRAAISNYMDGELAAIDNAIAQHDPSSMIGEGNETLLGGLSSLPVFPGDVLETNFSEWTSSYAELGWAGSVGSEVFSVEFAAAVHDMGLHGIVMVDAGFNDLVMSMPRLLP